MDRNGLGVGGTEALLLIPPSWTFLHFANTCGAPFTQKNECRHGEYWICIVRSNFCIYWILEYIVAAFAVQSKTLLQHVQDSQINKKSNQCQTEKMRDIACKKISLQCMLITAQNHINKKHTQYIIDPALHLNQSRGHLNWCMGLPAILGGNLGCRIV